MASFGTGVSGETLSSCARRRRHPGKWRWQYVPAKKKAAPKRAKGAGKVRKLACNRGRCTTRSPCSR